MKVKSAAVAVGLAVSGFFLTQPSHASGSPSPIQGIAAFIHVSDIDRSVEFFTKLVGLKEASRVPAGGGSVEVILSPGGTDSESQIALYYTPGASKAIEKQNAFNPLALFTATSAEVDDIAGKIAAAGYKTVIPPTTSEVPGGRRFRYAHMKGPDGCTLVLSWFDPAVTVPKQ